MILLDKKNRLRKEVKLEIQNMSKLEKNNQSDLICKKIEKKIPEKCTVCAYMALPDEVNLQSLIHILNKKGHNVYVPCYENNMVFRMFTDKTKMQLGKFGIDEPNDNNITLNPQDANIVLVPGRAFDCNGNRLGRGKGIYDLWIKNQRKTKAKTQFWGVAFACQMVKQVPTQNHDQKMDMIITAKNIVSLT